MVLGLPRGGVLVAYEIARQLRLPLDVFEVRKLGVPGQPELAMGAVGSGDAVYLNADLIRALDISDERVFAALEHGRREVSAHEEAYRANVPALELAGGTAILVDDGVATGATMRAAIAALRTRSVGKIVVAVPVATRQSCDDLRAVADDVVCLLEPPSFYAVGMWYDDFRQVGDDEVRSLVQASRGR